MGRGGKWGELGGGTKKNYVPIYSVKLFWVEGMSPIFFWGSEFMLSQI